MSVKPWFFHIDSDGYLLSSSFLRSQVYGDKEDKVHFTCKSDQLQRSRIWKSLNSFFVNINNSNNKLIGNTLSYSIPMNINKSSTHTLSRIIILNHSKLEVMLSAISHQFLPEFVSPSLSSISLILVINCTLYASSTMSLFLPSMSSSPLPVRRSLLSDSPKRSKNHFVNQLSGGTNEVTKRLIQSNSGDKHHKEEPSGLKNAPKVSMVSYTASVRNNPIVSGAYNAPHSAKDAFTSAYSTFFSSSASSSSASSASHIPASSLLPLLPSPPRPHSSCWYLRSYSSASA